MDARNNNKDSCLLFDLIPAGFPIVHRHVGPGREWLVELCAKYLSRIVTLVRELSLYIDPAQSHHRHLSLAAHTEWKTIALMKVLVITPAHTALFSALWSGICF